MTEPTAPPDDLTGAQEPRAGLVVEPYRNDHNQARWVFRCWGTDTCDGLLSLDHTSQEWAEQARDRHVAEEHTEPAPPALAAHHRTLAAVARVHADAIRSLHHHATSQLDNHTARLLHVLDDELARVLTQLAETADALQPQPGGGYDGPSVQEAAADDRRYRDADRDGG